MAVTTLISSLRLIRPINLLMLAVTQVLVRFYLTGRNEALSAMASDATLWILVLITGLIAAAGYIINDYYDIKIDLVNKPQRVVIGRDITRRQALVLHSSLNIAAVALGAWIDWKTALLMLFCATGMWLYSNRLKQLPFAGNFCISFFTGLAVFLPSFYYPAFRESVLLYALFAFIISLIREIIKDMEDVKGDELYGCKTLPIIWGIRKTKVFVYLLFVSWTLLIVAIPHFMTEISVISAWRFLAVLLFVPLVFFLYQADTQKDFHRLSNLCKLIMLLGVSSMLFI